MAFCEILVYRIRAFYGTSEFTERGSLYGHFFIWLLGGLNPSDHHARLSDDLFYVSTMYCNQYYLINCPPYFSLKIYSVNGLIMIYITRSRLARRAANDFLPQPCTPPGLLPTTLHRQLLVECLQRIVGYLVRLHSFCLSQVDIDVVCIQVVF